jgi:hypothetical protein
VTQTAHFAVTSRGRAALEVVAFALHTPVPDGQVLALARHVAAP